MAFARPHASEKAHSCHIRKLSCRTIERIFIQYKKSAAVKKKLISTPLIFGGKRQVSASKQGQKQARSSTALIAAKQTNTIRHIKPSSLPISLLTMSTAKEGDDKKRKKKGREVGGTSHTHTARAARCCIRPIAARPAGRAIAAACRTRSSGQTPTTARSGGASRTCVIVRTTRADRG